MIRYRYNRQVNPPAPMVNVTLCGVDGSPLSMDVAAQLDTGADRTVVPWEPVQRLGASLRRTIMLSGYAGEIVEVATALLDIRLHDLPAVRVEVAVDHRIAEVLLGRDFLNRFRIVLDGPELMLEMS